MSDFLVPKRIYQDRYNSSATSSNHYELLAHSKLHLNKSFNCDIFGTWRGAPFDEVVTATPAIPPEWNILTKPVPASTDIDIFHSIVTVIERYWNPSKFHVIFHSAGWDSRIINAAIRTLYRHYGQDWLGDILFLCNRWEAEPFREIMKLSGWTQYAVYDEGDALRHFASTLTDFPNAYRKLNAPVPICGNLWWYLIEWAQSKDILPADDQLQAFGGYWANETWECARLGITEWFKRYQDWYFYNVMAAFPFKAGEMVFPLTHIDVIRAVMGRSGDITGNALRQLIAQTFQPETAHIPNPGQDDRRHPIAIDLMNIAQADYCKSWYSTHVDPHPGVSPHSEFSKWWSNWTLASLCEHLIQSGKEIILV